MQTASTEVVRHINRRIVLNLIRTRQPLSRAELARISGMQRSTISLIVEELVAGEWVVEGAQARLPRGRRPTFLRLNEDRVIIGVDIRPTQTTVALADVNGRFLSREVFKTPAQPKAALDAVIARIHRIRQLCDGKKLQGVGISLPGRVNPATSRLVFAPNLKWRDVDLHGPITAATGLEVELDNAANACALAEEWFSPRETCRNLVVLTVSEGIGAGILIDGQLARGLNGMAGEFGHVPVDPAGPLCGCGSRGCWEIFASNRAAIRYYTESGPLPAGLTFSDLLRLADQGDQRAGKALESMAHHLGHGMRLIVAGLAPDRIVIIGDLTRSWERFGPIIERDVRAQVLPGGQPPQLVPAHEDGMARLRGTVVLVLQKHFGGAMV
ncbi:MAG: ROK family transcriptional regulator [Acidobacteriota bacterium]